MSLRRTPKWLLAAALALGIAAAGPSSARAQLRTSDADLVTRLEVAGRVQRIFSSQDKADATQLVELVLRSVALEGDAPSPRGLHIPAPGDRLFIVVDKVSGASPTVPNAGDVVRATVRDAGRGVWAATDGEWFQVTNPGPLPPGRAGDPADKRADETPAIELRGMTCEAKVVKGHIGLVVTSVQNQGPAHDAGFQRGDIIIAERGKPFASLAALRQLAKESRPLEIAVVDVNSGKLATVTLAAAAAEADASPTAPRDGADPGRIVAAALGITIETTRVDSRGALKVVAVEARKPGAEAGLEPGDVIVAVGRQNVASLDDFAKSLPERGGALTLVVRDVRTGKDTSIEAEAAPISTTRPDTDAAPTPRPDSAPAGADRLGLSTELDFYNQEAAVRVTAVTPGSPASRAGLRTGWIITKANDDPVMHPDDLAKAETGAAGRLTLTVVDPSTNRPATVTIAY